MYILAHKDDCAIVINGPTSYQTLMGSDGKGGSTEFHVPSSRACTCGGVLVQVDLVVPDDKDLRLATLASSSGGCSCQ